MKSLLKKTKKKFEPITQRLDKVEKAVRQTDEDLSKKLELIPINKKFKAKHLTVTPLEEQPKTIHFYIRRRGRR